jgi:energy-coupling factor transporter ATP-binding protein EcfA2
MVKLQWLQVNKFRSVKPGTRLTFNNAYNVLLGQNGTGKTTLLNLVAAAVKSDFTSFQDVEFDLTYELASSNSTATIWVRNEQRFLPIPTASEAISTQDLRNGTPIPDSELSAPALYARASIIDQLTGLELSLEIKGTRGSARRTDTQAPGPIIDVELSNTQGFPLWALLVSSLRKWANAAASEPSPELFDLFFEFRANRFDESLEYFNSLSDLQLGLTRYADGHISFGGNLQPTRLFGELLGNLARHQWAMDRYVLTDTDLPFLKHAIQLLDFESAEAIFELKNSTKRDKVESMSLGNLRFYFSHRGGWKIPEKMLSYGQKRMLAFMHYLSSVKSTVIADELVNGLHHRWIRACFEGLGQRQVFLTSQNPLLLDYLNFQSPEEVRSTFVLCSWERGPEQMVWENMSQEAAQDFFDSYKVGFQQVGELLQSKGLW